MSVTLSGATSHNSIGLSHLLVYRRLLLFMRNSCSLIGRGYITCDIVPEQQLLVSTGPMVLTSLCINVRYCAAEKHVVRVTDM